jgi:hypothetical protein
VKSDALLCASRYVHPGGPLVGKNGMNSDPEPGGGRAVFATTHWSVVLDAGQEHSPKSAEAMGNLCQTYWYPLYA